MDWTTKSVSARAHSHLGFENAALVVNEHEKGAVEAQPEDPAGGHPREDGVQQPRQLQHPQHRLSHLLEHG